MKKTIRYYFILVCFLLPVVYLQAQGYYTNEKNDNAKEYYISFSYGTGYASWYSHFYDSPLYNINGSIMQSGNLKIKASCPVNEYNFSVSVPVGKIRVGAGIKFENYSMDKLSVISSDSSAAKSPNNYLVFTENFWFNEIYTMVQVPFSFCNNKPWSLEYTMNAGFYDCNGIQHYNFFGDDQIASTYFVSAGFLFDYEVVDHVRIFVQPEFEYKYFHNNPNESPSVIVHNIFTGIIAFGIRADISKF